MTSPAEELLRLCEKGVRIGHADTVSFTSRDAEACVALAAALKVMVGFADDISGRWCHDTCQGGCPSCSAKDALREAAEAAKGE